jgi:outer membrane usher protein
MGLFEVSMNRHTTAVVVPVLFLDDKAYVTAEVLKKLRIKRPSSPDRYYEGTRYYALNSHPGSAYALDERRQAIELTVPTESLMATAISRRLRPDIDAAPPDYGGFLNYDLLAEYFSEPDDYVTGGAFELGVYAAGFVGTSGHVLRDATDQADHVRLETTVVRDLPDQRVSLRFGDGISRGGQWGRPVRFGGLQMSTNFATQPYFVTFPTPTLSGDAALPSSVDILVNDSRRFGDALPAGPFTIEDLPVVTGAGEVTAVVRDVLGRQTVISEPYYTSPRLLREQVHDFSFETGFLRQEFGEEGYEYDGDPFISGSYRYGYSDSFTSEIHAEFHDDRSAFGASGALLVGSLGVASASVAGSEHDSGPGGLLQLGFERIAREFSITAFGRLTTGRNYVDFGVDETLRTPDAETRLRLGIPFGRAGTLSASHTFQAFDGETDQHLVSASYSVGIPRLGRLALTSLSTFGAERDTIVAINLTVPLGPRSSASATVQGSRDEDLLLRASAQTVAPLEGGFGASAEVSDNGFTRARGEVSHTSRYGVVSSAVSHIDGNTGVRLNAVGGVAFADGGLFVSRRVEDSFAVASVSGQPDVRVYYENQLIGRTDSDGQLLIHDLRPYEGNRIAIEPLDLPFDAEVERTSATIAPRFRSGVTVDFPVDVSRTALLRLRDEDGQPVPAGAMAALGDGHARFPVGLNGELQLRGMAPGDRVVVDTGTGLCDFVLNTALPDEPMPDLGTFTCRRRVR